MCVCVCVSLSYCVCLCACRGESGRDFQCRNIRLFAVQDKLERLEEQKQNIVREKEAVDDENRRKVLSWLNPSPSPSPSPLRALLLPQLNDIKTNGDKVREKTAEIKRYRQVIRKAVLL